MMTTLQFNGHRDEHDESRHSGTFRKYVVPNYTRFPICLERGEGSYVWDDQGRRYLDFFPGWGCNLLGHCPPRVVEAIQQQAARVDSCAQHVAHGSPGTLGPTAFRAKFRRQGVFLQLGAEANEAAIKLARLHSADNRYKIITFRGGFHGRTYGATSATAQPKYHEGIGPLLPGFVYAPFGDLDAVRQLIDRETCAILIEPVQGEGGIRIPPAGFLSSLRELADEHGLLLIFDEVQSGCGRTGKWFAYQHTDVVPDVLTLAKSLCGGVAGAAMLTTAEIASSLRPGMHAATFGGNPIAARAGIATIEMIEDEGLLNRATQIGERFRQRLEPLVQELAMVKELRVCGLMIGIELSIDGAPIVQQCLHRGLLINCTQQTVLRLLPAMTLSDDQVDEGCEILANVLRDCAST